MHSSLILFVLIGLILVVSGEDFPCATPMCATRCAIYKYNEHGCMTCDCDTSLEAFNAEKESLCSDMTCSPGEVCELFENKDINGYQARCVDSTSPDPKTSDLKSTNICQLPLTTGPCRAAFQRFGFDAEAGECRQFTYGGCQGNENNFKTLAECQMNCSSLPLRQEKLDVCQQPGLVGPCKAAMPRFFFDSESGECQSFTYGGCQGNENNFKSLAECQMRCPSESDAPVEEQKCATLCANNCQYGYKMNDFGCPTCECEPAPRTKTKLPACSPESCMICQTGFDDSLCKDCACPEPQVFEVKSGCDGEDEMECDQQCPFGFMIDARGCYVCECRPPPSCPDLDCDLQCEHGLHHDENGCQVCECRQQGECPHRECGGTCPFGRVVDKHGCERCMCKMNPCEVKDDCPAETYCKIVNNTAECVMEDAFNGVCDEAMCMMHCQYGYKKNKLGCDTCHCLDEPLPANGCPMMKCNPCDFGMEYDEQGCRTCGCLPDPCKGKTCSDDEVCQAPLQCFGDTCRHKPRCIAKKDVVGADIGLTFQHIEPKKEVDSDALQLLLMDALPPLLHTSISFVDNIQVNKVTEGVRVHFHVQTSPDSNLVKNVNEFLEYVMNHDQRTSLLVDGEEYKPETESLATSYHAAYDDPLLAESSSVKKGVNTKIAAGIVVGIAAVVFIIAVAVIMTVRSSSSGSRTHIIYKRAASENDYRRPLTA